jgi:hypothetical protein
MPSSLGVENLFVRVVVVMSKKVDKKTSPEDTLMLGRFPVRYSAFLMKLR